MREWSAVVAVAIAAAVLTLGAPANAQPETCPLGSVEKKESGETWCEPTVCETDTNCETGFVCRSVALCVEIGVLDPKATGAQAEAGTKLLVRQRCGADKSCPSKTTCSEKGRCMSRAQADKAGLLTPSAAGSGAAANGGGATDPPKKACGCSVIGTRGGELGGAALALLGVIAIGARRRRRIS